MKHFPTALPAAPGSLSAAPRRSRLAAALLAAALVSACTTVPLPPWTRPQALPPGQPVAAVGAQPALRDAPYGPAVAARFPDPAVRYDTPGLAPGRTEFSSNAEVQAWLRALAAPNAAAPGLQAGLLALGNSQRGAPLEALVLTRARAVDASTLNAGERPTVLLLGQQHGDEPAGAEALLVIARELAHGLLAPLLQQVNVIVLPRGNPDGAAAGERATANGIDLNRDHLLLKTPEARALARLVRDYRPLVVLDAHEYTVGGRYLQKFGAVQRYDALLQYATTPNLPEFVTKAAEEWFRQPIAAALDAERLSSEWYYTTSTDPADLRVSMGGAQPDTSRNVNGLKNAVSLLLETRGVGIGRLHLQRRVQTQVVAISSVLRSTAARASQLQRVRDFVERDVAALACTREAVLQAELTPERRALLMLDPQTGADRSIDVEWLSALQLRTVKTRLRPCGYWLSAGAADAVERLRLLGVQVLRIAEGGTLNAESYRDSATTSSARQDVRGVILGEAPIRRTEVDLVRAPRDAPAGSYYVPVNQPLGNLVLAALEPDSQSSYYANHVLPGLGDVARVLANPSVIFEDDL